MRRRLAAVLAAVGLLSAGCASTTSGHGAAGGAGPTTATAGFGTRYGAAPAPNPAVAYQPDVVIVPGGSDAIRGVTDGGFTWHLDPSAAARLAVGKVMFVTGRSVGRVVAIRDGSGEKLVTVVPVSFTDVIKDGHFSGTSPVSLSAPASYQAPSDSFWADAKGSPEHNALGALTADWPAPKLGGTASATAKGVSVKASCCDGGAKLDFSYIGSTVRFVGSVALTMQKPTAVFDLNIQGGSVKSATLQLSGGAGLMVDIAGATKVFHNVDETIPIPTDFSIPFANLLGVPLSATVSQTLFVHTAWGSKDGNIKAHGEWGISGGLGFTYKDGRFSAQAPSALKTKSSVTDSIQGISTGVNAIAVGYNVKVTVGIGAFGFTAGPWFELDLLVNVARGSALGAPITVCNSAQVTIFASYGVGYSIPKDTADLINFFLEKFGSKPIEKSGGIKGGETSFSKIAYDPDTHICTGK